MLVYFFHAWYLDDGALAGKSSSVLKTFDLLQSLGPPLGFFVNLKKCELFGHCDLSQFPVAIQTSIIPNMEIFVSPVGDADFCTQFVLKKHKH